MAANTSLGDREAELLPIGAFRKYLEPSQPEPIESKRLEHMANLEDTQQLAREGLILRRLGIFILKRAGAGHAEPRGAQIIALRLSVPFFLQTNVDQRIDRVRDRGAVIKIEH